MTVLAETGVVGFGGFVFFIVCLLKRIGKSLRSVRTQDKVVTVSFFAGFVAMVWSFLTYEGLYWRAPSYLFWSYAGILAGFGQGRVGISA